MGIVLPIISIAAFVISLTTWITNHWVKRRSISLYIKSIDTFCIRNDSMIEVQILLSIINNSQLPIVIGDMKIEIDKATLVSCETISSIIKTMKRSSANEYITYSSEIPVSIPAIGCYTGTVIFRGDKDILTIGSSFVTFRVYTNRGKPKKIVCPLEQVVRQRTMS